MISSKLKSGYPYSLQSLFSGDNRKILIPDLQRDYCWAEVKNKEDVSLVRAFIDSLIDYFDNRKEGEEMNLGLIYAYEEPDDFVHLCDGQQRLTTLYLLIGVLYRRTGIEFLKNCLMSDYEFIEDDHEGYLQYAIRDTSLFFLNDLVYHYFIEKEEAELKKGKDTDSYYGFISVWFFDRYKNDKTINNICTAIHQIEKKLDEYFAQGMNRTLASFADFVLTQIKLLYYDVANRKQGEEMFVVINTTGLELTTTENLKPSLLGDLSEEGNGNIAKHNKEWEDREDFFWENKREKEQVADDGLKDFFSWILKIELRSDGIGGRLSPTIKEFKKIKKLKKDLTSEKLLSEIQTYFISIKNILKILNSENNRTIFSSISAKGRNYETKDVIFSALRDLTNDKTKSDSITTQQFFLLPLLAFVNKFENATSDGFDKWIRFLRYNYFTKKRHINGIDAEVIIETVSQYDSFSMCFETLFPDDFKLVEEFRKIDDIIIDKWCNDWDFMGNLSALFESALIKTKNTKSNFVLLEELKSYMSYYQHIQDIAYNIPNKIIDPNLIPLSNLLTFDYYYSAGFRQGNIQGQSYYSIDFWINNNNHILADQKCFSTTWKQLCDNGETKAHEELINKLSSKLETMCTGQFWLLLSCAEASMQKKSLGNYFCNQPLGLSCYNNNPYDSDNGGKAYNLKELKGNWLLYNSVGNSYVGHTYSNKKGYFDYRQNTLVAKVTKKEEYCNIQFQIKEREDYFFNVIENIYGVNLKFTFKYSEKQRGNESRYQLFTKIKESIESQAVTNYYEAKNDQANLLSDFETDGYSEMDWFSVGIPISKKYIIAVTSNRDIIQFGLRRHPESIKRDEQLIIIDQLKKINSDLLRDVDLLHGGWWYIYKEVPYTDYYNNVDFFVRYVIELYNELKNQE